jgi:putative peptidoglycan lipid II flippase
VTADAGAAPTTVSRTVARAAAGMGAATAASRLLGAVRALVIAWVLGTTALGNAFQGSNTFSSVLFELLAAGALSAVLVPTFVDLLDSGDREGAESVAGGLLGLALAAMGAVSVVGVLAAPWLASLLTTAVDDPLVHGQQQELTAFLLRFFVPQLVLYAVGAVATAVLHARRIFALPAVAPIGNTVVLVSALLAFRAMAGPAPGLELTLAEKLVLALGGTVGVAAFVAVPAVALRSTGFRLRPRWAPRDPGVRRLLRLSGWASVQHAGAGVLLLTAIVVGGGVEGGVVAYQVAFVFFLGPYGVLAQPIHTAVLPHLATRAAGGDRRAFAAALRWALASMAIVLLPVSAGLVALAGPLMRVLAFGQAAEGSELLAAALGSLALGIYAYGAFLLLARAWYALGDSRTPALAALGAAGVGSAVMVVATGATSGTELVYALGLGHSLGFAAGVVALGLRLARHLGERLLPPALARVVVLSGLAGLAAWAAVRALAPTGRPATASVLAVVVVVGGAAYTWAVRRAGALPAPLAP